MSISLHIARTDEELDLALRLRYQVYVEEEGFFPPRPDQRIFDRFDTYRGTTTVVARDNARPGRPCIGTLRFSARGPLGLPSDDFYDFSEVINAREGAGRFGSMGMLGVARAHRTTRGLLLGLCKVAWRELRKEGVRFIVAPCLDEMRAVLMGMGGEDIGPRFAYGDPPTFMTPVLLDMDHVAPLFRESSVDPAHLVLEEIDERRIYRQGEILIRQGDSATEAFIVMRGTARVYLDETQTPHLVGPGDLVGEIALLGDGFRTTSVIVESKLLDVGVIPKRDFERRLQADTAFVREVMGFLLRRVRLLQNPYLPRDEWTRVTEEQMVAQMLIQASLDGHEEVRTRWLQADTGLSKSELDGILQRWVGAKVISIDEHGHIRVLENSSLRSLARYLETAFSLGARADDSVGSK